MNSAIHRKNIQEQFLFGSRYISDTSVHCMTISTTTWVTTPTMPERVYCETCSFTATPYGGTQYSAQPAVSGFDLIVPIGGGLDIELTVEPGVQNTFTFDVTQLSSNALARFAVLEDSLGTLRELASELVTHRGGPIIKFNPTGNTVIFHVSNESLYNILVINIVEWYKSKTTTTQETILVEVCDEDKDRYRFGFNGQEKVNEWAGIGNHNTAEFWEYSTQTARRYNLDPVDQISISNYAVNMLSPIQFSDPNGERPLDRAYRYATKKMRLKSDEISIKQRDNSQDIILQWGSVDKDGNTVINVRVFKERWYERLARKGDEATSSGSGVNKAMYKLGAEWNPVAQGVTNLFSSITGRDMTIPSYKDLSKTGGNVGGDKLSGARRITTGVTGITQFVGIGLGGVKGFGTDMLLNAAAEGADNVTGNESAGTALKVVVGAAKLGRAAKNADTKGVIEEGVNMTNTISGETDKRINESEK